jgi:hypothetical protein
MRLLRLSVGSGSLARAESKDGVSLLSDLVASSRQSIVSLPGAAWVMMRSIETSGHPPVLRYAFTSDFARAVRCSSYIPSFTFVVDAIRALVPPSGRRDESPSLTDKTDMRPALHYECERFLLQPRLALTGDLTPSVESLLRWLGVKDMNLLPRNIHRNLTLPIERFVGLVVPLLANLCDAALATTSDA